MEMNMYRTHNCDELRKDNVGQQVRLAGWIDTIRDHGGVIFIDLRDSYGITQVVIDDDSLIMGLGREAVISVEGFLQERSSENVNPKLATGEVELKVSSLEVLSKAASHLPFDINESTQTREEVRLKYRFLDLRNPNVQKNIVARFMLYHKRHRYLSSS
jgi:aspartyl-tRNA synthetase